MRVYPAAILWRNNGDTKVFFFLFFAISADMLLQVLHPLEGLQLDLHKKRETSYTERD